MQTGAALSLARAIANWPLAHFHRLGIQLGSTSSISNSSNRGISEQTKIKLPADFQPALCAFEQSLSSLSTILSMYSNNMAALGAFLTGPPVAGFRRGLKRVMSDTEDWLQDEQQQRMLEMLQLLQQLGKGAAAQPVQPVPMELLHIPAVHGPFLQMPSMQSSIHVPPVQMPTGVASISGGH